VTLAAARCRRLIQRRERGLHWMLHAAAGNDTTADERQTLLH